MSKAIKPILDKVIQEYLDDQNGVFCPIATSRAEDFLPMLRRAGLMVVAIPESRTTINEGAVKKTLNPPPTTPRPAAPRHHG